MIIAGIVVILFTLWAIGSELDRKGRRARWAHWEHLLEQEKRKQK